MPNVSMLESERLPKTRTVLPPGPKDHWFWGCARRLHQDPLKFYRACREQYGDYVRIRTIPGLDVYLLVHPEAVEHVLQKNHKNYRKPDFFPQTVGLLAGNGILTSAGEFWLRQRRLMQPAFHRQHIAKLVPQIVAAADEFVAEQANRNGEPFDMLAAMMKLALRIAGNTLFSADLTHDADQIGLAYRTAFEYVSYRMNCRPFTPVWWPTARNREFARAKQVLDRVVLDVIARRRQQAEQPDDLLALLLAAQDEDTGVGMTDEQLKDEVLTLLTAGHETAGASLSWTWALLGQHPRVQEDLADEIRGVLGGRNPTLDDLPRLPFTRAVFDEALRLYPPAWGQPRESIDRDEIGGFAIPRRTIIVISQWVTHRHPDFWPQPDEFRPERFLQPDPDRPKFAYFPFGGGPRICIGNTFASMEGPLVLATILQKFRVELLPEPPIVPDHTFTLRPRFGVRVRLIPR